VPAFPPEAVTVISRVFMLFFHFFPAFYLFRFALFPIWVDKTPGFSDKFRFYGPDCRHHEQIEIELDLLHKTVMVCTLMS